MFGVVVRILNKIGMHLVCVCVMTSVYVCVFRKKEVR